jgi:hypothetical protein
MALLFGSKVADGLKVSEDGKLVTSAKAIP